MDTYCPTSQLRGPLLPRLDTAVLQSCVHTAAVEGPTGGEYPRQGRKSLSTYNSTHAHNTGNFGKIYESCSYRKKLRCLSVYGNGHVWHEEYAGNQEHKQKLLTISHCTIKLKHYQWCYVSHFTRTVMEPSKLFLIH